MDNLIEDYIIWRMLKQPGLISSDLTLLVIKCNCWTYNNNIGLKLKKLSFVIWSVKNLYLFRPEVCQKYELKLPYFRKFYNIFLNVLG